MSNDVLAEMEKKMKSTIDDLNTDLASLRTGRASPNMLDKITVDYYGAPTPLNQLATVSVPEPRMLVVSPYDKSVGGQIASTISKSDIGVQATQDGDVIRIIVPQLNEERRREMVKLAGKKTEDHKISLRNERREANEHLKKMEKDGELTKDDLKRDEDKVQELTDKYTAEADQVRDQKEKEIMEV